MKHNTPVIKKVIREMGGTIDEFISERGCFYANILGKRILIESKISLTRQSFVSRQLTVCKDITYKLLKENNLPTPNTKCFYNKTYKQDVAFFQLQSLHYPVIIKDAKGSNSRGIFSFISSAEDALAILTKELPHYRSMIVQEMVFGKEYRLLVLDAKIIGALEMIPPQVCGDSVSTVEELILAKHLTTNRKTDIDDYLVQFLKEQGMTLESVLEKGGAVSIKRGSCLAEGGETRDVTKYVHESIEKICSEASKAVGKYLVGIDVICNDISLDPKEQSFHILEVNGKPDLYIHYKPTHGKTTNVVKDIIQFMVRIAD